MSTSEHDLIFHLLDLQSRDIRIESEEEDTRECVYESNSDDSDEEMGFKKKKNKNMGFNQRREFVVHLFGATESGQPLRVDVTGFRPTMYLKLPFEHTNKAIDSIRNYLIQSDIPLEQLNLKKITRKVFYGFTANTYYPFLQIDVPSLALFRRIKNLFLDEKCNPMTTMPLEGVLRGKQVEVYEANIDPMLRFVHTQNIQPCGWVCIKNGKHMVQNLKDKEWTLECSYEEVLPTIAPRVSAPFLTASWDIECFSMTGDFPLAKRTWKKTAKEVLLHATDSLQAADLIMRSLSVGQDPVDGLPKCMTPIYCQMKYKYEDINAVLQRPSVQDNIQQYIKWSKSDFDSARDAMEKYLDKTLKNYVKLQGDPAIQIGVTLTRGTPETTERHLFVFPDCAPIDNIHIHAYKTEKAMINAWFQWMIEVNPDILIGYNVFGFDEKYLWERAEELGIVTANSVIHQFTRLFSLGSELKLEETFLSSSAMGDNLMYIWSTHGRLQIDLFHYIKRNNVLPSYKLDEVTKHFMSGKLKAYRYDKEVGVLELDVAGAVKDVKVGRAITLLDDTGETVSGKLVVDSVRGNTIVFNCELDSDALLELEDATKWVIVKDDVSPQDIFRLHRQDAAGRAIVGRYCLQDCDLVIDLYRKLETFNNTMCMANVCSVPLSYIFKRGQGIKIESLIFKACRDREILIPVLTAPKQRGESGADDSYEGAIVLDPEPGFYSTSPIGVCDFASLYPSTIVSENISHDSLVWVKDFKDDGTLIAHYWGSEDFDEHDGYAYTDIEYDIWRPDPTDMRKTPRKIRCGRRICRYAQPLDGTKSTLPQITTWLLNAREAKKKEMKAEKDPERYALLDAEQLAYKLTGNSLYGQLGSGTFKIRLQALAASVTAYGRKQILFAKAAIEKFYGPGANRKDCVAKVMYGDTDSLFVEFNVKNPETGERLEGRDARQATIDITDEAGAFITKALKAPHDFEFDKAFDPMLMFSKKRYAGNMYENNADDYVHKYMGIALKRRDNAPIVKTIFGGAMKMLLNNRDVAGAFKFVKDSCVDLVDGKVSLGQLTITKSLRADYANPQSIAHKVLADRILQRDPGNAPAAGDRIGYVYISPKAGHEAAKLQGDRIETPQYVRDHNLIPDYKHYIEHQLQNPISQMFGLLLDQIPGVDKNIMLQCPKGDIDKELSWREARAAELLFTDCLRKFETLSRRNAMSNFFGGKAQLVVNKTQSPVTSSSSASTQVSTSKATNTVVVPKKQMTMSSYLLDSYLVDGIKKKERATAAAKKKAAAAAETTETAEE